MAGGWWPQGSTFCGCQKVLWFLLPFLKEKKKVWCPKIFLQGGRDELRPSVQALVTAEVRPSHPGWTSFQRRGHRHIDFSHGSTIS